MAGGHWRGPVRVHVIILGAFAALMGCSGGIGPGLPDDSLGRYGSLLNAKEFEAAPHALLAEALIEPPDPPALPAAVILPDLPPVGMQGTSGHLGSPGSCEAWSFGYGLGSYTASRYPDGSQRWSPLVPMNQVSPAWLYSWAHLIEGRTCPTGTLATPYLSRLILIGAPSMQDVPYVADCGDLEGINVGTPWPDEGAFRIGSFATFQVAQDPAGVVTRIKQYLAGGQAVAFSGLVLKGYSTPVLTDGVIYGTETIPKSGHGQLVVGYDDTIGTASAPGAFLVQNSFGTAWPPASSGSPAPPGMAWWSYDTFVATQKLAAIAFPRDPSPPAGTMLTGTSGAPAAAVARAWQWSPVGSAETSLILWHMFAEPVELATVTLTEPPPGTHVVTATYDESIGDGYTYIRRSDGMQFLAGTWGLQLDGTLIGGTSATWTGLVDIGSASPGMPPPAPLLTSTDVTGTTGAVATVSP